MGLWKIGLLVLVGIWIAEAAFLFWQLWHFAPTASPRAVSELWRNPGAPD